MLKQTLSCLQESIIGMIVEEKFGIEGAFDKLREGESLSIGFKATIVPPNEESPDTDLTVDMSYVVERRKVRKKLKINENQIEMDLKHRDKK